MLLLIFLVLLLLMVQVQFPATLLVRQVGAKDQTGPRDNLPEPTVELARARRALGNLQETLPAFLTLALLSLMLGEKGWMSMVGGGLYLACRVGHFACYMLGLSPWRSICYIASLLGLLLMAFPLFPHIWM